MGVNVVYAPVLDVAIEPGQPGARDPRVRRRPGGGRAARGGVGARAAGGRAWPRRSSTPRGWARSAVDTHHGVRDRRGRARGARGARVRAVPGRLRGRRPARHVRRTSRCRPSTGRARSAGDAVTGRDDRPAPSGARVRWRHDLRRARHGRASPRARPGGRRHRRGPGRRRPAALLAGPRRPRPDRGTLVARRGTRPLRCRRARRGDAARVDALRAWLGSRRPAAGPRVVGCAEHRALARELAARSMTLVRGRCRDVLPAPAARRRPRSSPSCRRPTDLTPADTSSTVAPGLAAALRARPSAGWTSSSCRSRPTTRTIAAALRARATPPTASSSARSMALGSRASPRWSTRSAGDRHADDRGRACAAPWDVAAYPAAVTARAPTRSCPTRSTRSPRHCSARSPFAGRLPVAVDGVESRVRP